MTIDLSSTARQLISDSSWEPELADFASWLEEEQYTGFIIEQHLRRLAFVALRLGLPRRVHSPAELCAVFGSQRKPRSRFHCFAATRRVYQRFLLARGRLRVPHSNDRFADLRRQYAQYLIDVRGLSVSSRRQHAQTLSDFLARALRQRQSLRSLTRSDVERFIQLRGPEISRHSLQHTVAHLRAFLRYAHDHGYVRERLDVLDTPRTYREELPPRAVAWPLIRRLLSRIDLRSKAGRRDACILHLISHYGLRPSEVVALRTDSVDWVSRVLHVHQCKTRSDLVLPLDRRTLQVIRDYLQHDLTRRASTHPALFHRARCPHGPLERTAIGDILYKRSQAADLPVFASSVCRLRHTFAMRLLTRGVGIKAIGDLLGHRNIESTRTYLRLDVHALRGVALEVPGWASRAGGRHA